MRYAIIPKIPLSEAERIIKEHGGKDIRIAPRLGQIYAELEDEKAGALEVKGFIIKKVQAISPLEYPAFAQTVNLSPLFKLFQNIVSPPLTGEGINIAILDSGIRKTHIGLKEKVIYEANFTPSPTTEDIYNHGSGVAYIACGGTVEGDSGAAPGMKIVNIKVIGDDGKGTTESVVFGLEEVLRLWEIKSPFSPHLVNLSLGFPDTGDPNDPIRIAVRNVADRGRTVFCAAGNDGPRPRTIVSPACDPHPLVVAVGAMKAEPWEIWERSCLTKDSRVLTESGLKYISEIKIGERVFSYYNGKLVLKKVLALMPKGRRKIYEIRVAGRPPIRATSNHPFLTIAPENMELNGVGKKGFDEVLKLKRAGLSIYKIAKLTRIPKTTLRRWLNPPKIKRWVERWKELEKLKEGDYIAIFKGKMEGEPYRIPDNKDGHRRLLIPQFTTPDFMWLLGLYLGDGNLRIREGKYGLRGEVKFSIPEKDKSRERLLRILRDIKAKPRKNKDAIYVYSLKFARLLEELGLGGDAYTRKVPQWVYSLPVEQRKAFIEGFLDGDGHQRGNVWYFTSCNKILIEDIANLAILNGMSISSFYQRESKSYLRGREINSKCYYMSLRPNSNRAYIGGKSFQFKSHTNENLGFGRITKIIPLGEEEVFDIAVEESENFFANGYLVHNSRGPTVEGYIKPDVVFIGVNVLTASAMSDDAYMVKSGTSFACPAIAGIAVLGWEFFFRLFGRNPLPEEVWGLIPLICRKPPGAPLEKDTAYGYGMPMAELMQRLARPATPIEQFFSLLGFGLVMFFMTGLIKEVVKK